MGLVNMGGTSDNGYGRGSFKYPNMLALGRASGKEDREEVHTCTMGAGLS